jgi:hypothetical protein
MNKINNFILEKLKINSKSKINNKDEEFYEKTSTDLLVEVQNTIDKTGEYHTYTFEDGQKKFKKGFIYANASDGFIGIQAFNKSSEFEDLLGIDEGEYKELDSLSVGNGTEIDGSKIIRIW